MKNLYVKSMGPRMWLGALWLAWAPPLWAQATPLEQGWASLSAWQLEESVALAQKLLCQQPQDPEAQLFAAATLHQLGAFLPSWQLLQASQSVAGQQPTLLQSAYGQFLMERMEGSAQYAQAFQTLASAHFRIQYIDKDVITATYAQDVLEAAYKAIGQHLHLLPAEQGIPIGVEIYPNARGLADATGLTLSQISKTGTIAVAKFHRLMITSPLATAAGYKWADALAHEFSHLVISKASGDTIPVWFHEGLARYLETSWRKPPSLTLSDIEQTLLKKGLSQPQTFVQPKDVHRSIPSMPTARDAALAYAQYQSMIHYLIRTHGEAIITQIIQHSRQGQLSHQCTQEGQSEPAYPCFYQSLQQLTGRSLAQLHQAWLGWLAKQPLKEVPLPPTYRIELLEEGEGQDAQPSQGPKASPGQNPNAQKHARLAELLELDGFGEAAAIEYQQALDQGGWSQDGIWLDACKAWFRAGRPNKALPLLERGLRQSDAHPDADMLATRIYFANKQYDKALHHGLQAIYQNPYNPDLHNILAELYQQTQQPKLVEQAQRFAQLAQAPRAPLRPQRPQLPQAQDNQVALYLTTPTWQPVNFHGQTHNAPAYPWLLPKGQGTFTWQQQGQTQQQTLTLKPGQPLYVCLQGQSPPRP